MRANTPRRTILVTGFGAFPGSRRNPTETIVARLRQHRPRLARLGVDLHCVTLPVVYAALHDRLEELAERHRPDVILHFGVAGRRRRISVETRAVNRAGPLHPDASGRCPAQVLLPASAHVLPATVASRRLVAALRTTGFKAELSRNAGDYVCNATLYRSLVSPLAPEVGFIHVPRARPMSRRVQPDRLPSPSHADLAAAALVAVLAMVRSPLAPSSRVRGLDLSSTRPA